jgi:hypothetical protein
MPVGIERLWDVEASYWVGWASAIACFAVTYSVAKTVSKHSTLHMALALFAISWVLVAAAVASRLDAIQKKSQTNVEIAIADRALDVAAFLLVLVGAMMMRERPPKRWLQHAQRLAQMAALALISYLVLPDKVPYLPEWLTSTQLGLGLSEALGVLGFASLVLGVYAIGGSGPAWVLLPLMTVYESLSLYRMLQLWPVSEQAPRPPLEPWQTYSFVLCRVLVTAFLCWVAVKYYTEWLKTRGETQLEVLEKQVELTVTRP